MMNIALRHQRTKRRCSTLLQFVAAQRLSTSIETELKTTKYESSQFSFSLEASVYSIYLSNATNCRRFFGNKLSPVKRTESEMGTYGWTLSDSEWEKALKSARYAADSIRPTDIAVAPEDLQQIAVLAVWEAIVTQTTRPKYIPGWARTIGRNACLREVSRSRVSTLNCLEDCDVCEEPDISQSDDRAPVIARMSELTRQEQEALRWRFELTGAKSIERLSDEWNVCHTRIRQISQVALSKLRHRCSGAAT